MDDFEDVSSLERGRGPIYSTHDLAVALDCDTLARKSLVRDKPLDRRSGFDLSGLAVDRDLEGGRHRLLIKCLISPSPCFDDACTTIAALPAVNVGRLS